MTVAEREGVRVAYQSEGSGPPLLLIHGLGYDRAGWGPLPQLLAGRFSVLRFDNRGLGESDVPPGPYSVAELAGDAAAVLDAEGIPRAHVVGTSLGGMIAQELALAHPARVDRLVLACTTPGGATAFPTPERTVRALGEFPAMPLEQGLRLLVENALSDRTLAARPRLVEEIHAYRLAHRPPLAGWQAQAAAAAEFDAAARLEQISAPTLVLHGTADNVVDVRNGEALAQGIPGARLELFEGCGHLFFWEEPERFARSLGDFLLGHA
jgi:3-oxoadipate enol-lactonase